jgi:Tfp pilus assembly protein PilF
MMIGMVKRERQKTKATTESGTNDGRHQKMGNEQFLRVFQRTFSGYALASLAIFAIAIACSLGVISCSSLSGSSRFGTPGGYFSNTHQSPTEVSRLLSNAHYYELMGRPELAIKELEQAHEQAPDNLKILNILAQKYEEVGQFEPARKLYQEALTKSAGHPALANNLCFTYYLEGHWQKAEKCYRQILAQDPNNEAARNNLGLLYCRLGRQDEARNLWQEAEGPAAAAYKTRQVLAVLEKPDSPVYSEVSAPAPIPVAAVRQSSSAADKQSTPAQPLAPEKVAMQLTPKPVPENLVPDDVKPLDEVPLKPAPAEASPEASPAPATWANSRPRLAPLTAAELVGTAIEVRNGNGWPNMASQTRVLLNREGFTVAKIGNHIDFGAETTIIYFRPESERIAQAVNRTLFPKAKLQSSAELQKNIAVKILLGADLLDRPQLMARLSGYGR